MKFIACSLFFFVSGMTTLQAATVANPIKLSSENFLAKAFHEILGQALVTGPSEQTPAWVFPNKGVMITPNVAGGYLITCNTKTFMSRAGGTLSTFQGCTVAKVDTVPANVQTFTFEELVSKASAQTE